MNGTRTLAAYLQQLRLQELQSKIDAQVVYDCLELLSTPIQQVLDNYLKDNDEINLFEMIVIAVQEAERVVTNELNEADAIAVISRVIGNVAVLFDKLREENEMPGIPQEILEVAAALQRGRSGLGRVVVLGLPSNTGKKSIKDIIENGKG